MNLIEFAVGRKLRDSDPLLEYVATGKAVPISILECSFEDLLSPLIDAQASHLVSDYVGMLQAYIPTTHTIDAESGRVRISGNIPDDLLEAIEMVHEVPAESVISEMIQASVGTLSRQDVTIKHLDLSALEEAAQITLPEVKRIDQEILSASEIVAQGVKEMQEKVSHPETVIENITHTQTMETTEDASQTNETLDVVEDMFQTDETETMEDAAKTDETLEMVEDTEVFEETSEVTPSIVEDVEVSEEMSMEETLAAAAKIVYNKLIRDFNERGLNEKLGLNYEPAI